MEVDVVSMLATARRVVEPNRPRDRLSSCSGNATIMPMGHIQIKNVPEDLHEAIRRRAAKAGRPVREYVLRTLEEDLSRPTLAEWFERVRAREPVTIGGGDAVRDAREEREHELDARMGR